MSQVLCKWWRCKAEYDRTSAFKGIQIKEEMVVIPNNYWQEGRWFNFQVSQWFLVFISDNARLFTFSILKSD